MAERTEGTNTERTFGILSEKPTVEELAEQIKISAVRYGDLLLMFGELLECLNTGADERKQYNLELFEAYIRTALKADYLEREVRYLKDEQQEHYSQVHSNKKGINKYNKYI